MHIEFPASRANVKPIVNNLSELDDRLGSIEMALRQLTEIVKEEKQIGVSSDQASIGSRGRKREADYSDSATFRPHMDTDRYNKVVVQQTDTEITDGINAPFKGCSLLSLCYEIRETVDEVQRRERSRDPSPTCVGTSVKVFLPELYECIDPHGHIDITHDGIPILLPPRQLLSMASVQFFQLLDVATDIFCKETF